MRLPLVVAPIVAMVACQLPSEEYSPLLPDSRLLMEQTDASSMMRSVGDPSHYAETLANLTEQTNAGLGEVLALIDAVTTLPPSYIDNANREVIWGPWSADGVFGQLTIQELDSGSHTWAIQIRPEDQEDWSDALVGEIDAGSSPEESTGRFTMDFAVAETLGAGEGLSGEIEVDYAIRPNGAAAEVTFSQVAAEGIVPVDGGVSFAHEIGNGGHLDAMVEDNVQGTATAAPELVNMRARWDSQGAGRTDARLTGGDFADAEFTETECWSSARTVVFYENTFDTVRNGEVSSCAFADAEFSER